MNNFLTAILLVGALAAGAAALTALKAGTKAPDFTALDQEGRPVKLSEFQGKKNVVLYFYPKDFTKGCTAEACAFRDNYEVFSKKGAVVIGASADSAESHRKFIEAYKLPFILISDPEGKIAENYGVNRIMGLLERVTFVIDKKGVIRFVYFSMKEAVDHADSAMKALDELGRPGKK